MEVKDLAYTAGLIDGEGSILLTKHGKNEYRAPAITMTNTCYELLDYLRNTFKGSICNQKIYKQHHKPSWVWKITHKRALSFCELILPYLKETEKLRRATLLVTKYKHCTPPNGVYTPELHQLRNAPS